MSIIQKAYALYMGVVMTVALFIGFAAPVASVATAHATHVTGTQTALRIHPLCQHESGPPCGG